MKIRKIRLSDIPAWRSLSSEFDGYIIELVSDLTEWYEGSDTSIAFDDYMNAKIKQNEAYMAIDDDNQCLGIIAVSITNNRITFFGVSHHCDFMPVGEALMNQALQLLNLHADISVNCIKSNAKPFANERELFHRFGFVYAYDTLENGVPASVLMRYAQQIE